MAAKTADMAGRRGEGGGGEGSGGESGGGEGGGDVVTEAWTAAWVAEAGHGRERRR